MTKEEAIGNVRSFIGQLTAECQESIRTLIPELYESKDERIRHKLEHYIKYASDIDNENKKEVLAWLEKLHSPLPSNLEEAVEEYAPDFSNDFASKAAVEAIRSAFITGAKWMTEQGETQEHFIIDSIAGSLCGPAVVCYTKEFVVGDEVIVQIRKKKE